MIGTMCVLLKITASVEEVQQLKHASADLRADIRGAASPGLSMLVYQLRAAQNNHFAFGSLFTCTCLRA